MVDDWDIRGDATGLLAIIKSIANIPINKPNIQVLRPTSLALFVSSEDGNTALGFEFCVYTNLSIML